MEQKVILLDTLYGFAIKIGPNVKRRIRTTQGFAANLSGNVIMFKNHEIAALYAGIQLCLNPGDYSIILIKNAKGKKAVEICSWEDMDTFDDDSKGLYSYYYPNGDVLFIKERYLSVVQSIQYIVFNDGDVRRTEDRKEGMRTQKHLLNLIRKAAVETFYYFGVFEGVKQVNAEELEISFKNSTSKIHICTNGNIARFNKIRKETGSIPQCARCIPFLKDMDKYTTFFMYIDKDSAEPNNFGFDAGIDEDIKKSMAMIIEYLKDMQANDPDFSIKTIPVEFNGTILVDK